MGVCKLELNTFVDDLWQVDGRAWRYDISEDAYISGSGADRKMAGPEIERKIRLLVVAAHEEKEQAALKQAVDLFNSLSPISRKNVLAYINQKFLA